jgi:predicted ATPase
VRSARVEDYFRRLAKTGPRWDSGLQGISIRGVPALGDLETVLPSPLCVIAGANGAGKSALLRCISAATDPDVAEQAIGRDLRMALGEIALSLKVGGNLTQLPVSINRNKIQAYNRADIEVDYTDTAADVANNVRGILEFKDIDDLLNGVDPVHLTRSELEEVGYLSCRDYSKVDLYEIDIGHTAPFFRVSAGGTDYDLRSMGLGEACIFHLWWVCRRARENSFLLFEEPEAFLSHASQEHVFKYFIRTMVEKKAVLIVATHSPAAVDLTPPGSLLFLSRVPNGSSRPSSDPHPGMLTAIGIVPRLKAVLLSEDAAGRLFCKHILERLRPSLARTIAIESRGGDGGVGNVLQYTRGLTVGLHFIGVFDGDLRDNIPPEHQGRYVCLPGDEPVEKLFKKHIQEHADDFAHRLNEMQFPAIAGANAGRDHHDWLPELARALGMNYSDLFARMFEAWMSNADNANAAERLCDELAAVMGAGAGVKIG